MLIVLIVGLLGIFPLAVSMIAVGFVMLRDLDIIGSWRRWRRRRRARTIAHRLLEIAVQHEAAIRDIIAIRRAAEAEMRAIVRGDAIDAEAWDDA